MVSNVRWDFKVFLFLLNVVMVRDRIRFLPKGGIVAIVLRQDINLSAARVSLWLVWRIPNMSE